MARPRKEETDRLHSLLRARCSEEEFAAVKAKAERAGLSVSEFVRQAAVTGRVVVRAAEEPDFAVASELRRIGNNINQQMVLAHVRGELPAELRRLWAKLETILDRIIETE